MDSRSKVVIVGSGPGGGAAAVRLLQRGVKDVVLLDRDDFPREKTCGSALSPNGLMVLDELGIGAEVREVGYLIHSLIVRTPGNRDMKLTTDQAAIVLLRKHFDNMLLEKAKSLGADFRPNFKAMELIREDGRVVGVRGKAGGAGFNDAFTEVRGDYVLCADGAHSVFSWDERPKRTISTLMGWWSDFDFEPGTMEMIFDKNLSPLYGWMFPETTDRVNIGICMDGEENGKKTTRNVREVFQQFLQDHYSDRLPKAKQIGKFKGHPISYTTWIKDCTAPGVLYLGEGARMTHNATGEGIFHAMQSGIYAADAVADVTGGKSAEAEAWKSYVWKVRKRFTFGFVMGHVLRGALKTPLFDTIAMGYNSPTIRKVATWAVGSALAGSQLKRSTEEQTIAKARGGERSASEGAAAHSNGAANAHA